MDRHKLSLLLGEDKDFPSPSVLSEDDENEETIPVTKQFDVKNSVLSETDGGKPIKKKKNINSKIYNRK